MSDKQEIHNILNSRLTLDRLILKFPEEWKEVNSEILSAFSTRNAETINNFMSKTKKEENLWKEKLTANSGNPEIMKISFSHLLKIKMTFLALEKYYLALVYRKTSGTVKFNFINGYILQKLLFYHDLVRKPVSLFWFNFFWRLNSQKNILMPLVHKKGIYCFYSKKLISCLLKIINNRTCIEIAAGDGTLTEFLKKENIDIRATDDFSWKNYINYPGTVENLDAENTLLKYKPQVVVCSWPPPGNVFEKKVFETESVETYIVIGSKYDFASGNHKAYSEQKKFSFKKDPKLAGMILPHELDNAVFIFERVK